LFVFVLLLWMVALLALQFMFVGAAVGGFVGTAGGWFCWCCGWWFFLARSQWFCWHCRWSLFLTLWVVGFLGAAGGTLFLAAITIVFVAFALFVLAAVVVLAAIAVVLADMDCCCFG